MIARDELLEQFLAEGRELIARGLANLAVLAETPADGEVIDDLFRTLHTLKGSAGLFELPELTALLHATETRLEETRRQGRLDGLAASAVERALDVTDAWLDAIDRHGEPTEQLRREATLIEAPTAGATPADSDGAGSVGWAQALAREAGATGPAVAIRYSPAPDAYFRGDDPLAILRGVPGLISLTLTPSAQAEPYDPFQCGLVALALSSAPLADVRLALRLVGDQAEIAAVEAQDIAAPSAGAGLALRSLRIDAQRLDDLAALVDELVIAKNGLLHQTALLAARSAGRCRQGPRAGERPGLGRAGGGRSARRGDRSASRKPRPGVQPLSASGT